MSLKTLLVLQLLTFLSVGLVECVQSEILHQMPHPLQQTQLSSISTKNKQNDQQETQNNQDKFLLITNGDQIKLFPFLKNNNNNNKQSLLLSDNFYLIKTKPLNATPQVIQSTFGSNILSDFFIALSTNKQTDKRKSILPSSIGFESDQLEWPQAINDSLSGLRSWQKPWITEVDYAIEHTFDETGQDCVQKLIIVWLDKRNQFIRSGLLDLKKNPIENKNNILRKSKTLYLEEHAPLDMITLARKQLSKEECDETNFEIQSISYHKSTKELRGIVQAAKSGKQYVFTTFIQASPEKKIVFDLIHHYKDTSSCYKEEKDKNCNQETKKQNLKNFLVDEQHSYWYFYLNSIKSSSEGKAQFLSLDMISKSRALIQVEHFLSQFRWLTNIFGATKQLESEITAIALDSSRKIIYSLDSQNRIISSNFWGTDTKLVGELTNKVSPKNPFYMQLFDHFLLISCPIRRTLISYNLKKAEINRETSGETLLLDMKAIYGFKIITLKDTSTYSTQTPEYATKIRYYMDSCYADYLQWQYILVLILILLLIVKCLMIKLKVKPSIDQVALFKHQQQPKKSVAFSLSNSTLWS